MSIVDLLKEMKNYIILHDKLSRLMKYTVKQLQVDFPDDVACLEWLVQRLYATMAVVMAMTMGTALGM